MSFEKLKSAIEAGKLEPVYFLSGEESYYIDVLTELISQNALTEAERDFNEHIFYGKDSDPQDILNTARRYPVFAEKQLILVKEAQHFRNWDVFVPYIKSPVASTVLVFAYKHKKIDKRKAFGKLVKGLKGFLETSKLRDYKIPDWIVGYLAAHKKQIDQKSAYLLKDHLGNDLSKITNELDKLLLNLPDTSKITAAHIEEHIGISKDFNAFELSEAISSKNYLKAMQIVKYFEQNPKAGPMVLVLAVLYNYFAKLFQMHHNSGLPEKELARSIGVNPYFFKDYKKGASHYSLSKTEYIIGQIASIDAKSKGIGNTANIGPYELLKELTYKIMN